MPQFSKFSQPMLMESISGSALLMKEVPLHFFLERIPTWQISLSTLKTHRSQVECKLFQDKILELRFSAKRIQFLKKKIKKKLKKRTAKNTLMAKIEARISTMTRFTSSS